MQRESIERRRSLRNVGVPDDLLLMREQIQTWGSENGQVHGVAYGTRRVRTTIVVMQNGASRG